MGILNIVWGVLGAIGKIVMLVVPYLLGVSREKRRNAEKAADSARKANRVRDDLRRASDSDINRIIIGEDKSKTNS